MLGPTEGVTEPRANANCGRRRVARRLEYIDGVFMVQSLAMRRPRVMVIRLAMALTMCVAVLVLFLGAQTGSSIFFTAIKEQGEDGVEHISQSACISTDEAPDTDYCHDEFRIFALRKVITEARQGFFVYLQWAKSTSCLVT